MTGPRDQLCGIGIPGKTGGAHLGGLHAQLSRGQPGKVALRPRPPPGVPGSWGVGEAASVPRSGSVRPTRPRGASASLAGRTTSVCGPEIGLSWGNIFRISTDRFTKSQITQLIHKAPRLQKPICSASERNENLHYRRGHQPRAGSGRCPVLPPLAAQKRPLLQRAVGINAPETADPGEHIYL